MTQFQYTAVNSEGKKLSGVIGAPSETDARKQLNVFGISVLELTKTADGKIVQSKAQKDLQKFEFEAYDKGGQRILGTIPAQNRTQAFMRLKNEYQFEVSYIVTEGVSLEEKEKAKQEDLSILKAQFESEKGGPKKEENLESDQFKRERASLLGKVDFILDRIKLLLKEYDSDINPQNKTVIQGYIDKLLRIKSSTNLEYIEHTSEELLKKIQDQELFLHKEKMELERDKLQLQTQQLMATLHSGSGDQRNISDDLHSIQKQLSSTKNPILEGIAQFIQRHLPTPEEKALKRKISTISKQIWKYRKVWLMAPKTTQAEAYQSVKRLLSERKRLQTELSFLRRKGEQKNSSIMPVEEGEKALITQEVTHFIGWLLSLYLGAYFLSHYFVSKAFPNGNPLPGNFNLLNSSMLQNLLISLFLWYIFLRLRLTYLKNEDWANLVIIPVGLLINALVILNF